MHRQLCAYGCGEKVTPKVELQHMNALGLALLASEVLQQNHNLICQKKRSQAIGFPVLLHHQLAMGSVNAAEIHDMDIDDDDDINDSSMVMEEDLDESYGQLKSCCSAPNDNFYIDHPGPSTLSNNVPLYPYDDGRS